MCEGCVRCESVQGMNRARVCEECVREGEGWLLDWECTKGTCIHMGPTWDSLWTRRSSDSCVLLTRRTGDRRGCTSSVFSGPLDGGYWGRHHEVCPPTPPPPHYVIPHSGGCLAHWTGVNVWKPSGCSYEEKDDCEWEMGALKIHGQPVSTVGQFNTILQNTPSIYTQSGMYVASQLISSTARYRGQGFGIG